MQQFIVAFVADTCAFADAVGTILVGRHPERSVESDNDRFQPKCSTAHTSTSDQAAWDSGTVAPGGHFSFMFQNAGTFSYHCTIHPGMIGTIVVH
jgi:hypothetical protein